MAGFPTPFLPTSSLPSYFFSSSLRYIYVCVVYACVCARARVCMCIYLTLMRRTIAHVYDECARYYGPSFILGLERKLDELAGLAPRERTHRIRIAYEFVNW